MAFKHGSGANVKEQNDLQYTFIKRCACNIPNAELPLITRICKNHS